MHATDKSGFIVSVYPKNEAARQYRLNYDSITRTIVIPSGLLINRAASTDIFGNDSAPVHARMEYGSNIGAQSLQLANIQLEMRKPKLATAHDHVIPDGNCQTCFGAHHSNGCGSSLVKSCFDCHLPTFKYTDHANNCSAKWYTSEQTNAYIQIPSERCVLTFKAPIQVLLDGQLKMAQKGLGMFSAMSDSYFKFESDRQMKVLTTDYSRVRIPVIAKDGNHVIEKLVVMTSYDRSLVVAKGSREVGDDPLGEYKYNTPIVLYFADQAADIDIEVHSEGGVKTNHNIEYIVGQNRFTIPKELDLKKKGDGSRKSDAPMPLKMKRK